MAIDRWACAHRPEVDDAGVSQAGQMRHQAGGGSVQILRDQVVARRRFFADDVGNPQAVEFRRLIVPFPSAFAEEAKDHAIEPFLGGQPQIMVEGVAPDAEDLLHLDAASRCLLGQTDQARRAVGQHRQPGAGQGSGPGFSRRRRQLVAEAPQPARRDQSQGGAIDGRLADAPARSQLLFSREGRRGSAAHLPDQILVASQGNVDRAMSGGGLHLMH